MYAIKAINMLQANSYEVAKFAEGDRVFLDYETTVIDLCPRRIWVLNYSLRPKA